MSRSRKKHPFSCITTCKSANVDKTIARRIVRRVQNTSIRTAIKFKEFDVVFPAREEYTHNDVWGWDRDGKQNYQSLDHKDWFRYCDNLDQLAWQETDDFKSHEVIQILSRGWCHKLDPKDVVWPPEWWKKMWRK